MPFAIFVPLSLHQRKKEFAPLNRDSTEYVQQSRVMRLWVFNNNNGKIQAAK